jgi:hypothetical protein
VVGRPSTNLRKPRSLRLHARTSATRAGTASGQAEQILQSWLASLPKQPMAKLINAIGQTFRAASAKRKTRAT